MEYRCPKHGNVFMSSGSVPPGYRNPANASDPANQPTDCHNDCPLGQRERNGPKFINRQMLEARARTAGVNIDVAAQQAVAAGFEIGEGSQGT